MCIFHPYQHPSESKMAQIIEVFEAEQVKEQKQRDKVAEVEAARQRIRANERERMSPEDRRLAEGEEARRKKQAKQRRIRFDEHLFCVVPHQRLDRAGTRRLVRLYQDLYARLDNTDHPLASAVRRLEKLERAINDTHP
jgi:hypothetical protein